MKTKNEAAHFAAWLSQAQSFVAQGGTLTDFVAHAAPTCRSIARTAYETATKGGGK